MAWTRFKKKDMPGGLWLKCPSCGEVIYKKDLEEKLKVCPKCDHHHTLSGMDRVRFTLDEGSAQEIAEEMEAVDRLDFHDKTKYSDKLIATMEKTKRHEAMWIGTGRILGREVAFGALDFSFLGGSMGVVVGEKVAVIAEYALEHDLPLVLVAASGGARMHEGALSLMQMAKSCYVLGRFDTAGKLYISVLANPTTGGVTASWATQADVVLAEPGALIGFAGPRVIKTTLRQDLPEGFQRAEFLIEKGQIDRIVHRAELRETVYDLMDYCLPHKNGRRRRIEAPGEGKETPAPEAATEENGSVRANGKGKENGTPKTDDHKLKGKKGNESKARSENTVETKAASPK
ncbi:MAG: acetyl-CoA carboxylase, carboxyltransferase subunit beta [Planctomycetes bacterium]|nr:acetyl-CoA carboxylase, carboxyltransferase subunit beta [Planctomycetota bacterium]